MNTQVYIICMGQVLARGKQDLSFCCLWGRSVVCGMSVELLEGRC